MVKASNNSLSLCFTWSIPLFNSVWYFHVYEKLLKKNAGPGDINTTLQIISNINVASPIINISIYNIDCLCIL